MPNTKAVGVAYSDPEFESVTVTGAISGASVSRLQDGFVHFGRDRELCHL
jgi:hypothetical protein